MAPSDVMPCTATKQTVGDLAQPVPTIGPEVAVSAVEGFFRARSSGDWVIVQDDAGPALLTRGWLEPLLAQRGGRRRRRVCEVAPESTVVVPADCSIGSAAALLAERRRGRPDVPEGVVVTWPDGTFGVLPATILFEHLAQHYAHQAEHDPLTGLRNRRGLVEEIDAGLRRQSMTALMLVDLDHFKRVNDERSHDAGDAVLRELGALLTDYVSEAPGKFVARLGGEEFVVVWEGWTSAAVSLSAEALRVLVTRHDWHPCTTGLPVTVSIGFAATDESGAGTWSDLVARADARLYEAKRGGRDRVVGPAESPDPGDAGTGR
jgi:diguanylate cyclase (GGDEF)-like protein